MAEPIEVAIVGMAAVFPGAPDLATYWSNILAGVDAITDVPASRWDPSFYDPEAAATRRGDRLYCRRGGFVAGVGFDPVRFGIMPMAVPGAEPDQLIALHVAAEALADAGGEGQLGDRSRAGVIIGRGGYLTPGLARLDQRTRTANQLVTTLRELLPDVDEARLQEVRTVFQARLGPDRPEAAIDLVPNLTASRVANRLDLAGPAYTVDAACASSLVAIDHAVRELTAGRCDVVLAGGVHHCHDITLWSVFSQLGALSPTQRVRPFHCGADGILIGEGTGMVVLKRLADADDDRVYAVIRGTGVASDGRATSLMSPRADGQVLAVERAWQAAGLDPTEPGALGLLEAHGTATPVGDETELVSLSRVFGPPNGAGHDIGIGSVKSMIGHAMPAAGIAGLIKAALAVHHGVLPPTLNCDDPHPALAGTRFSPVTAAAPWPSRGRTPRRAGIDAFGFGGINAHAILEQPPDTRRSQRPQPSGPERVLLLAGSTLAELERQLQVPDTGLLDRGDAGVAPDGGPCRLAIVAPTARRLALARRIVAQGTPWRGRDDVWFTAAPLRSASAPGRLAFVFPGLEPEFAPRVDDVADHFGLPRPDLGDTGTLVGHGTATVAVGRLLDTALRELGISPDVLAGHSVGEWTAMIAAGMYPESFAQSFHSVDREAFAFADVQFLAMGCGVDQAKEAIAGLDGIVVSHDNCPHQSVICGGEDSVAVAGERLRARGVLSQLMPFRSGYHTPMISPYLDPFRRLVENLPLRAPAVPVWSATTVTPYPESVEGVRDLAVRHLVEPVRFRELIARLHADGVGIFVEAGPGSLTGFIGDTLRGEPHLAIPANTPRRNGLAQLRRVVAALWVEGHEPRFGRLHTDDRRSQRTPPAPAAASSNGRMLLRLGAPLVRLGDSAPQLVSEPAPNAVPATGQASDDPVLHEFSSVLAEATATAETVLRAWRTAPVAPQPPPTVRTEITSTREFSLRTMPFLADHCLVRQRADWPDPTDRYPIVPMTTLFEVMADTARELVPGATVVGLADVRAMRPLAVAPPAQVSIIATRACPDRVEVVLDGYAQGTVVLADAYPTAPAPSSEPLSAERPADITASQLYTDRWMFHGPAFHGVTEIGAIANDGARGVLASLPAPGGLLDNAGQLFGYWIMARASNDRFALPARIGRVEFFGPHPAPGQPVGCTVWVRSVDATSVRADLELTTEDSLVWCRIAGWEDHRLTDDELSWRNALFPDTVPLSEPRPGGWYLSSERWRDGAMADITMRRYLRADERADYQRRNPRARRGWLLGRIAVKDAARQWLWNRGAGRVFPAEIAVSNDDLGRPLITLPSGEPFAVSIAHTGPLAVALVRPGAARVGIDIEAVAPRTDGLEETATTPAERELLNRLAVSEDRVRAFTRFWAAKEAVAKAEDTGLGGTPRRFVVWRVDGDRLLVTATASGRGYWVATSLVEHGAATYVVAWTED